MPETGIVKQARTEYGNYVKGRYFLFLSPALTEAEFFNEFPHEWHKAESWLLSRVMTAVKFEPVTFGPIDASTGVRESALGLLAADVASTFGYKLDEVMHELSVDPVPNQAYTGMLAEEHDAVTAHIKQ